jgi:Rrf2 family transcriptional regulator, repressor of oqxAB
MFGKTKKDAVNTKWFGMALQALTVLALSEGSVCPSKIIAGSLRSQATLMRRILTMLVKAQIVEAREGRDGGYRLLKSPSDISLEDVYEAIHVDDPLSLGLLESTSDCTMGRSVNRVFGEITVGFQDLLAEYLQSYTLADFVAKTTKYMDKP